MADYAPPTLADLWALVGRDLTDPSNKVFNTSQLTDYINGGIAELNRVRPLEATYTVTWDDENDQLPLEGIPLYSVFQVELRAAYGGANSIVPNIKGGQPTRDGWDFYNGTLFLGSQWFQRAVHSARDNGWTVESATSVVGPWTPSDATPFTQYGRHSIAVPTDDAHRFFRLR